MISRNLIFLGVFVAACGSSPDQGGDAGTTPDGGTPQGDSGSQTDGGPNSDGGNPGGDAGDSGTTQTGKVIFVIPMENQDQTKIIGNPTDAPYINKTLLMNYATASAYQDTLALNIPSEPHYVWMEAGTNKFSDPITFTTDADPSSSNSTKETNHLVTQLENAKVSWMSYQEGINANTGACPIHSNGYYAAKHDPFVFFQDVSGSTPSATNPYCMAHHKDLSKLSGDLANSTVADYNFVTPDLCNDMHGAGGCPQGTTNAEDIQAGDTWLKNNLQPMIDYAIAHDGYVFIVWDEGDTSLTIPFIAIGKNVKVKYSGPTTYSHSSLLKSEEEILGVPVLSTVSSANDFADLFTQFP